MTRRLGIILATTLVALLVMTDGAWACRCMNRLINRCGYRRACCCILLQPNCCQAIAVPGCCQPAAGEMKAAEGAPKAAPIANKPAGGAGVEVVSPSNTRPDTRPDTKPIEPVKPAEPVKPPEKPAEPKPLDLQPAQSYGAGSSCRETRGEAR